MTTAKNKQVNKWKTQMSWVHNCETQGDRMKKELGWAWQDECAPSSSCDLPIKFYELGQGAISLCLCVFNHIWILVTPGSSVHGNSQARIAEWVAMSFCRGSSWPRDRTRVSCVSCIGKWILYPCAPWEALRFLNYKMRGWITKLELKRITVPSRGKKTQGLFIPLQ